VKKQINSDTISKINGATRMCIVCRVRFPQKGLYRFQENNKKLVNFQKTGRSFYVCATCITNNRNKLMKILNQKFRIKCENIEDFGKILKELDTNG